MVNSISGSGIGAIQDNIKTNNSGLAKSIARLAAGKRLVGAGDDVAALSIATGLQTQVSSLRTASLNINQASSMLQVADGAMGQIGGILDRMSALATQANSGALSEAGRAGVNSEFQALADEINRLAGETNFNGNNLIDGSLSNGSVLETSTAVGAQASGALQFTANVGAGQTVALNGVTLTEGVDFNAGATVQETTQNLANALNTDSRFEGFSFEATNGTLGISADAAGEAGNQFTIDQGASTAAFTVQGDALSGAGVYSLQGGDDAGLSSGDVTASGSVGDSLVTGLNNAQAASTTATFNSAADINAGDTIQIDNGEGGFTTFTFVNGAPTNANEIEIGNTLDETLNNAATTMENYSGADGYGTRQLDFSVDGNRLVITNETAGNASDVSGAALDVNLGTVGGTLSNVQLNNGSTGGIDVSNVTAEGFIGNISGFEATFNSSDNVTVSVDVGGETFTANVSNTNAGANNTVRFASENGGFFDVELAGGNGQSVTSQTDANNFASRLDSAFSSVEFRQSRDVTNFNTSGDFNGASLQVSRSDFSGAQRVDDVNVTSNGMNSRIDVTVNGETFRSEDLGRGLVAGERITLTADNGDTITYTNGNTAVDLSTSSAADSFESDFQTALGVGSGAGASFQVGDDSNDSVNFTIGDLSTDALFSGETFNLLSAEGAVAAFGAIGAAIDTLTSQRADVGAYQQALDYTAANVDSAIQNQEAARSVLQDTDLASESTLNKLFETQAQAGIATLAQSNRLSGNLLQLLVN